MKPSMPETEGKVAALALWFGEQPDGQEITWKQIEAATGIKMTIRHREYARRALRRIKRPYEPVRGDGIILSSPTNTMRIISRKFIRIDNSVRRAGTTQAQLAERHFEHLDAEDKQRMLTLSGFFGAVRAFASQAKAKILQARVSRELG